jgi:hypothetical protein
VCTRRAKALHGEHDFVRDEACGDRNCSRRVGVVQADDCSAASALEVGMRARVRVLGGIVSRDTIFPGDLVREATAAQPVEHPINGHAIDAERTVETSLDFVVTQCALGFEQHCEYLDPRPRKPCAGFADHRLGSICHRLGHVSHFNTSKRHVQLCCVKYADGAHSNIGLLALRQS